MLKTSAQHIDAETFHADVQYIESLWRRVAVGALDLPLIDTGLATGEPLVFVPILEHLEFVYARQLRAFSRSRRVILYRRHESRSRPLGLVERAEELRRVLDTLGLASADFLGHGDAAMVLFEFAARYPQRCRSLIIIAQGADYQIAPHPFIWLLHELFLRLPIEGLLPAEFLRRLVINYIVSSRDTDRSLEVGEAVGTGGSVDGERGLPSRSAEPQARSASSVADLHKELAVPVLGVGALVGARAVESSDHPQSLPRAFIEEQFRKIALWPYVYKFSELPIIHYFDMRKRLDALSMPVLLINRAGDPLSPEARTRWLAANLPNCAGYHVLPGRERFFMYAQAEEVNALIERFLASLPAQPGTQEGQPFASRAYDAGPGSH